MTEELGLMGPCKRHAVSLSDLPCLYIIKLYNIYKIWGRVLNKNTANKNIKVLSIGPVRLFFFYAMHHVLSNYC